MWNSVVCVELRTKSTHTSISQHVPRKRVRKWVVVCVDIKNGTKVCVEFKCVWIGDNTIAMPKTRKLVPLLSEAGVSFLIFDT